MYILDPIETRQEILNLQDTLIGRCQFQCKPRQTAADAAVGAARHSHEARVPGAAFC